MYPCSYCCMRALYVITKKAFNPRTDGGLGHLSTDGEGRIAAPRRSKKRRKLETSGKRNWIRADDLYNFYRGHFNKGQVKNDVTGEKKSKWRYLRTSEFFSNNFWTNWARAKLRAPSRSSRYASKYVYNDLIRSRSSVDLRSRDLYVNSRSKWNHLILIDELNTMRPCTVL